jgi:5'-3' exonuclease
VSGPLFLLDGTLLFFRALYGTPDVFHDARGRAVNGVRGYLGYVLRLLEERQVSHCVAAFDESLNSCWRNEVYPAYKANRPPADENIRHQLDLCHSLTRLLGIPVLADADYEADDYIATLARRCRAEAGTAREAVIVSRDKDLQQLLEPGVVILDPRDGTLATRETFIDGFGFEPALYPDYQALTGDSVDNIPGVRGIGPKAASRLVCTFGDLETIYRQQNDWSQAGLKAGSKTAQRLLESRDEAFLFRRILRLDDQAPVAGETGAGPLARPDRDALLAGLAELGLAEALGRSNLERLERLGV